MTITLLPLLFVFLIGYALKRAHFLSSADGSAMLKLIFYAGMPALIFVAITKAELDASLLKLCFFAPLVVLITLLAAYVLRKTVLRDAPTKTFGSLVIGAVLMNTAFSIPFVQTLYGAEGLARLAIVDAFNALVAFTLVYAIAVRFGHGKPQAQFIAKKLLLAPPVWALILALTLKVIGVKPPDVMLDTAAMIAPFVAPVILLALGLKLTFKLENIKLLIVPVALRFVLGGLIGLLFVNLFGLEGLGAQVVILASLAPIGFNSITFSELENLDVEFAASQVSAGLLVALAITPFVAQLVSSL